MVSPVRCPPISSRKTGQRQSKADPEAPRHVDEFVVRAAIGARDQGLQRHAADRAGAGADLTDLRMHRAGIDRAFRLRLLVHRVPILVGIGPELGLAASRTEVPGLTLVLGAIFRRLRIDVHAADGVPGHACRHAMSGVMLVFMSAAAGLAFGVRSHRCPLFESSCQESHPRPSCHWKVKRGAAQASILRKMPIFTTVCF